MSDVEDKSPLAVLRYRAMDLLARREHSAQELETKLTAKFPEFEEYVSEVVSGLQKDNLQSDRRFAEAFIVSRIRKGQGPYRISQELQQRGIASGEAREVLAACGQDWFQLAAEVMLRKYGGAPCDSFQERARRSRFLQYRGFSGEQIQSCFDDD
ncbi:MAG: regulatory protein RecX [Gammaproteobacteria bacterium]|nr:MAG: regulatory protein RecX [Gammaproteobacteria bacterium]